MLTNTHIRSILSIELSSRCNRLSTVEENSSLFPVIREKKGECGTREVIKTVFAYWKDLKSNIFRNCPDAVFGILPLLLLPAASLFPAVMAAQVGFWNYTFPIFCISIAGIYDAYGRIEDHNPKNIKLGIRIALNSAALFLSAVFMNYGPCVRWIPGALLTLSGALLLGEICLRVSTAFRMSEWYPR